MPGIAIPGIYWMAALTLAVSALVWGAALYWLTGRRRRYLLLILPGLPFSALVNLAVKGPLARAVAEWGGIEPLFRLTSPLWFLVFVALLAPWTEELIKVAPLLLPGLRRAITDRRTGLWTGLALGIGFGLGEAAFLAWSLASVPAYAQMHWTSFGGYFSERLAVTFAHGMLTAIFTWGLAQGWQRGLLGYLTALLLHALINLGAILSSLKLIDPAWITLPYAAGLLLLVLLFDHLRRMPEPGDKAPQEEVLFER